MFGPPHYNNGDYYVLVPREKKGSPTSSSSISPKKIAKFMKDMEELHKVMKKEEKKEDKKEGKGFAHPVLLMCAVGPWIGMTYILILYGIGKALGVIH